MRPKPDRSLLEWKAIAPKDADPGGPSTRVFGMRGIEQVQPSEGGQPVCAA